MARVTNRLTTRPSERPTGSLAGWLARLLLALASIGSPALAADDPPGRVGRVTEGQGQVYDTEAGEWIPLERNRPLTSGDRVAVDDAGRLEIRIGSTVVRLAGGSELEIRRLDDDRIDLFLHDGGVAVRVRSAEVAREVDVATADGRFSPRGISHFRVDRRDDSSVGTAWIGELQFESDDSALSIPAGRSAELWREGAKNATHYAWGDPQRDDFADWTARADREDDRVAVPEYVSPEMTGAEDLNRYGRWESNAEYGPVWYPTTVVAGWAPYRYGHWVVVRPWGWTWVDYAPWGFAPFHYGRWVHIGGSWCWTPGHRVARPVYSPAMVAWIGGGAHYGRGPWPYLGWVPLAPREPYYPHYTSGRSYWRAVNSAQMSLFPGNTPRRPPTSATLYTNQGVAGAVSVVPGNALVPRRPVAPVVAQVDPSVRNNFATQPWRTHVPPPGVARPIAVPGGAAAPGAVPPRVPAQPPRPPGHQPSPAVMAQPGTPPTGTAPAGRRERIPRTVPPPPNVGQVTTAPRSTTTPPAGTRPPGQGNVAAPAQPRVGLPTQPHTPVPQAPAAPRAPAAAPAAQVPAPAAQPPAPPSPGRLEPSTPGAPRSPGRSSRSPAAQPPQARAVPAPAAAVAVPPQRQADRVAAPPRGRPPEAQQRGAGGAPPAAHARVRVPEWQGHPNRAQMR